VNIVDYYNNVSPMPTTTVRVRFSAAFVFVVSVFPHNILKTDVANSNQHKNILRRVLETVYFGVKGQRPRDTKKQVSAGLQTKCTLLLAAYLRFPGAMSRCTSHASGENSVVVTTLPGSTVPVL